MIVLVYPPHVWMVVPVLQQLVDSRCVTVQQDLQEEAAQLTQMNVLHIHVITMGRVLLRYLKSRILYCLSCCKPNSGISDLYHKMRVIQWPNCYYNVLYGWEFEFKSWPGHCLGSWTRHLHVPPVVPLFIQE